MTKRAYAVAALLVLLSSVFLSAFSQPNIDVTTTRSTSPPCMDKVQVDTSWERGIVLTLNDCLVKDIHAQVTTADFIAGFIAARCPTIACGLITAAIAAFLTSQAEVLLRADEKCNDQGAFIEIGSLKDETLWAIRGLCERTLVT